VLLLFAGIVVIRYMIVARNHSLCLSGVPTARLSLSWSLSLVGSIDAHVFRSIIKCEWRRMRWRPDVHVEQELPSLHLRCRRHSARRDDIVGYMAISAAAEDVSELVRNSEAFEQAEDVS